VSPFLAQRGDVVFDTKNLVRSVVVALNGHQIIVLRRDGLCSLPLAESDALLADLNSPFGHAQKYVFRHVGGHPGVRLAAGALRSDDLRFRRGLCLDRIGKRFPGILTHGLVSDHSAASVRSLKATTLRPKAVVLTLSGIDMGLFGRCPSRNFRAGLPRRSISGYLIAGGSLIADPVASWSGHMDQPTIDVGGGLRRPSRSHARVGFST